MEVVRPKLRFAVLRNLLPGHCRLYQRAQGIDERSRERQLDEATGARWPLSERSRPVLRITEEHILRWLETGGTVTVLIVLIRSVTGCVRERQRLRAFLVVAATRSESVALRYTQGRCVIRADPPPPNDAAKEASVVPFTTDGQSERWRRGRRPDAPPRVTPGP